MSGWNVALLFLLGGLEFRFLPVGFVVGDGLPEAEDSQRSCPNCNHTVIASYHTSFRTFNTNQSP